MERVISSQFDESEKNIESLNHSNQQKAISENPVTTLRGGDLKDYVWKLLVIWYAVNSQAPVEGFTVTPNLPKGNPQFALGAGANQQAGQEPGLGGPPKAPSPRIAPKKVGRPEEQNRPSKSEIKYDLTKEYSQFQKTLDPTIQCSQERFDELSTDPQRGIITQKSIDETNAILQAEAEGIAKNPKRPNVKQEEPNLDFKIDGPGPYKYADIKIPIDFENLGKITVDFRNLDKVANRMGRKITLQKGGADNVLHIVDLKKIPFAQHARFQENVLKAAGSSDGIVFINSKNN